MGRYVSISLFAAIGISPLHHFCQGSVFTVVCPFVSMITFKKLWVGGLFRNMGNRWSVDQRRVH